MTRDRPSTGRAGRSGEEVGALTLARVFCGIAAAEVAPWLTVAVVDDAGRLLDLRHLSDDPAGYAQLGGLLADRSSGVTPVALDRGNHLIGQLLAAARQPLAVADQVAAEDFSERFSDDTSYDEMRAPVDQRRAVGLARALQAGALHAMIQNAAIDLDELKPVLGAHAAVAAGRQAAATALREVLRELYPAALRAFPDPAEFIPLKVLDALPEPSLLSASPSSRQRDAAIVADLAATGVTDAQTAMNAISALRVSVEESPRWGVNRALAPVVGETVRQAVAAVRAADAASAALVAALVERLGQLRAPWSGGRGAPARPYLVSSAPVSPAPRRIPGPAAEVPPSRLAARVSAASAAASGVPAAAASIPAPRSPDNGWSEWSSGGYAPAAAAASYPEYGAERYPGGMSDYPTNPGTAEPYGYPSSGEYSAPLPSRAAASHDASSYDPLSYDASSYDASSYNPLSYDSPSHEPSSYEPQAYESSRQARDAPPASYEPPAYEPAAYEPPTQHPYPSPSDDLVTTLSFTRDPLTAPLHPTSGNGAPYAPPPTPHGSANGGWNDPRFSAEPPLPRRGDPMAPSGETLSRPAEPVPRAVEPLHRPVEPLHRAVEPLHRAAEPLPRAAEPLPRAAEPLPRAAEPLPRAAEPLPRAAEPVAAGARPDPLTDPLPGSPNGAAANGRARVPAPDDDLLIFSQTQSAWFTYFDEETLHEPANWSGLADDGWRAAEHVSNPTVGAATTAGLPRRVPQANLVPGSAQSARRELRIVRDAQSIAAHTDGYFRGWRRGQEIGGYAVGQRDRAAWEFNRDQRARLS